MLTDALLLTLVALAAGSAGGFFAARHYITRDARSAAEQAAAQTMAGMQERLAHLAVETAELTVSRHRGPRYQPSNLLNPVTPSAQRAARQMQQES